MKLTLATMTASVILLSASVSHADGDKVPYPDDYRNWTHVKSMLIEPEHPLANPFHGVHHVYGNEKALDGLKNGKHADGAVLVFDLLNYVEKDNTIQEGDRKLLGVMHKDAKKYGQTGGWGFEGFAANSKTERLTKDDGVSCFACHSPEKSNDYVFSRFRE